MDDPDKKLLVRNITIACCLAALGAFVTTVSIVTIMIATNFNFLEWME